MAQIFKTSVFHGTENSTTNVQVAIGVPPSTVITFAGVYNAAGDTLTSITLGGNAMTLVGKIALGGGTPYVYLYHYVGATEGAYTIDVNRSGASGVFNVLAVCLYNTNNSSGIVGSGTGQLSGSSVTASLDVGNGGWAIGIGATTGNSPSVNEIQAPLRRISTVSTKYFLVGAENMATTLTNYTFQVNIGSTGGSNALAMGSVVPSTNLTGNVANVPRYIRLDNGMSRGGDAIK